MERSEREREIERARRLRQLSERAFERNKKAREQAEELKKGFKKPPQKNALGA